MVAELKRKLITLYDTDYNLWVFETVKKLEKRDYDSIDWDNLIEEIFDLSKRDKRKLKSLLKKLFEHLLKLKYWKSEIERNKGHWQGEIRNFRQQIKDELKDSPSLKSYLQEIFEECYQESREIASDRTQLPLETFPESSIGNLGEILDKNWFP